MISIIIPAYNEEKEIAPLLEHLTSYKDIEIIVVDGESTDKTKEIVARYPVKYISCKQKRSQQQNRGACLQVPHSGDLEQAARSDGTRRKRSTRCGRAIPVASAGRRRRTRAWLPVPLVHRP